MEVDEQPSSSDKAAQTGMDCSLVLELPQRDPLYDKKKKLLQMKGLNPKECIYIKNSSCPDAISTNLKALLQITRIMHLDEVEIYFSEDDECSLVELYSPRNEVEALNSILSLVDISLSTCTSIQMNSLQRLREAVVEMLRQLGEKCGVGTTNVQDYRCAIDNCLLQWGESNGVRTTLQVAYIEGAGRGMIAKEDLNVGDIALEVPLSIVISEELVQRSDMYPILEMLDGISSETMLLLWSMKEKHNSNSKFKKFFDALPKEFNSGLSFGIEAISVLDETLLFEEIMQAKEHLRIQYNELFPALCNDHPDIFPAEFYTWEQFLWACELWYSNSMKIMFADGITRTCLVPVAGFLNHSLCPHVLHYGKADPATNSLKFPLSRPCRAGEQCYLSYGNFSSAHFVTFYGFLPQGNNPYDIIPLEFDTADDETDGIPTSDSTHMVRGTWLSNNRSLFHYGLPSPLLEYLRKAQSSRLDTKCKVQGNLENEIEVLENIRLIFDGMMDKLDDANEDRHDTGWDVKLALAYKDLQRNIISSVLTSCYAGLKMLQHKLMDCMSEDILG